jgi:hypothetical protein
MMASVRPRLLKTPAEPSPELRISAAAAQTRAQVIFDEKGGGLG